MTTLQTIEQALGKDARSLLDHKSTGIAKDRLHLPDPTWVSRMHDSSDRPVPVLRSLQAMFGTGRLRDTGYLSILPVDQGIEHSAGASFAKNPDYFDPENIVKLAVEGGCNAVASTLGVLGACARKYAHRIPFIVKVNHNEFLTYPNKFDQIMFGQVKQARDMGATAVGATIYFGSDNSSRQIVEVSQAFHAAHEMGLATILWCYLRNPAFKKDKDYHLSADLTGQANHLGVTIEADIIKQKLPENNGGYDVLNSKENPYGKTDKRVYTELSTDHPIDLTRYQLANCYMGRAGLINSGGASGENDFAEATRTAVINKRAGGMGLISGRKAFQRPMADGVKLLNTIQDVYLCKDVTIADLSATPEETLDETQTEKRLFTYAEAQALLPRVQQLTQEAQERVERLLENSTQVAHTREQAQSIVNAWAAEMGALGLDIKGLWLVDFDNGSGYYCWKHPEPSLDYYHTYEEGFSGRIRIQ